MFATNSFVNCDFLTLYAYAWLIEFGYVLSDIKEGDPIIDNKHLWDGSVQCDCKLVEN